MWTNLILLAAGLVEFCIWAYFCFYVMAYVVPWGDMREKREISRALALRLPALRKRAATAVLSAGKQPPRLKQENLADIATRMSDDSSRLALLCCTLVETIAREHKMWPREALQIETDVVSTLDVIEKLCDTRDTKLPAIAKLYVDLARDKLRATETIRQTVWARASELAAAGAPVRYELGCLTKLGNALSAYQTVVDGDPDKIAELAPKWVKRLRQIAESFELRAAVHRRLGEVRAELPARAERVRTLLQGARMHLPALRQSSSHQGVALRMAALDTAEEGIARAESELNRAEAVCHAEGTDVGSGGKSYLQLAEGLRSVERSNALLATYEEDLAFIAAVVAMAAAENPKNVN